VIQRMFLSVGCEGNELLAVLQFYALLLLISSLQSLRTFKVQEIVAVLCRYPYLLASVIL
jgi:hypothetical protein